MALPRMIQAALNMTQGLQQYAASAISDEDLRQLAGAQIASTPGVAQPTLSNRIDSALTSNGVQVGGVNTVPTNQIAQFDTNNYVAPPQSNQQLIPPDVMAQIQQQNQVPQFDKSISQFSPAEQQLITSISNKMGLAAAPAGIIGGQIVDIRGNPIPGAPSVNEFGNMMAGIQSGSMTLNDIGRRTDVTGAALPQTGLIGAEQALQGGLAGATGAMLTGAETARQDITGAAQQAQQQLGVGREQVTNAALTANQMAQQGLAGGRADIMNQVAQQQAQSLAPLMPYLQQGGQAAQMQAALSGALGSGAQQEAYRQFNESPGQSFLTEQAERGLLRNQAAIGGLGGGRVREELQRQAMGLAQQDFGNYYNRLSGLAGQGLQAGGQASSLLGGLGGQAISQLGSTYNTGAGITGNLGANLMNQLGSSQQLGAQMTGQAGQSMGNIAQQTGMGIGSAMLGTGQQIGADRLLTGQQLAANIGGTSTALANLANQYGMSVSDLLGATGGNLANLLSGTGAQIATGQQNLGTTLGNIYMGQGSQAVGLPAVQGVQQTGPSGIGQAVGGLVGGGLGLFYGGPAGGAAGAQLGSQLLGGL